MFLIRNLHQRCAFALNGSLRPPGVRVRVLDLLIIPWVPIRCLETYQSLNGKT